MKTPIYQKLASLIIARKNCAKSNNVEWFAKHTDAIEELCSGSLPHGSGVDSGTKLDIERSSENRLVFSMDFHHMDEGGSYDGWSEHEAIVTPSLFNTFDIRLTGRDRNGIKEYLADILRFALSESVEI